MDGQGVLGKMYLIRFAFSTVFRGGVTCVFDTTQFRCPVHVDLGGLVVYAFLEIYSLTSDYRVVYDSNRFDRVHLVLLRAIRVCRKSAHKTNHHTNQSSMLPNHNACCLKSKFPSLNETQLNALAKQGFTSNLAALLANAKLHFPLRIWIVDNSGSMARWDGRRVVGNATSKNITMERCSRWSEIASCVEYHMRLAALLETPTSFRLLNNNHDGRSRFDVNDERSFASVGKSARHFRRVQTWGTTPLTPHIRQIKKEIEVLAPSLRQKGQRVCVVIATDGLPTSNSSGVSKEKDREILVDALRDLEGLPVWVVIRLCTDDDKVVSFWNDIDSILELDVDVLDDFIAEAKEVAAFNPWINYALPLHRIREFGSPDRLFDLIDERPFTKSEVRDFCQILFGQERFDGLPDPNLDWKAFLSRLSAIAESEDKIWNPVQERPKKWVSSKRLRLGPFFPFR